MIGMLAKSIREYKKASIATPLLVSMEVVMECIIPFLIAQLVNQIKGGCELSVIAKYGLVLVIMAALSLMFGALAGMTCATASCGLAKNLRKDMFYNIQNYSFENIDRFSTSSLVTRLTTDITNVQVAYMMIIRTAIRSPLMLVFAFVMAVVMGGRMAWIFAVVIPILGIGLFLVAHKTMPLFRKVFKKYDALNSSIQENVKGIRVVKSFVRENYEEKKFGRAAEDVCADFTKAERILALNNPLMQFCIYSVMVFVLSLRFLYHYYFQGPGSGRGTVFRAADLQLYDAQQPDDAFHDLCDDHHGRRIRQAYRGGAGRDQHPVQSGTPGIRSGRRLH